MSDSLYHAPNAFLLHTKKGGAHAHRAFGLLHRRAHQALRKAAPASTRGGNEGAFQREKLSRDDDTHQSLHGLHRQAQDRLEAAQLDPGGRNTVDRKSGEHTWRTIRAPRVCGLYSPLDGGDSALRDVCDLSRQPVGICPSPVKEEFACRRPRCLSCCGDVSWLQQSLFEEGGPYVETRYSEGGRPR